MKGDLEFANFTLTFGQDKVLLDLFEEIVLPSFLDDSVRSAYHGTNYNLINIEIIHIPSEGRNLPCIIGQFVKDMVISREQVLQSDPGTTA